MNKPRYVGELERFYMDVVGNPEGIDSIDYVRDTNGDEWIYVSYSRRVQKRFSINCDGEQGILFDFVYFLNNQSEFDFLTPNRCI